MDSIYNEQQSLVVRLAALGSQTRLQILQALIDAGQPMGVSEVARATHYLQPKVSRHIQALLSAGIVSREQSGRYVANVAAIEATLAAVLPALRHKR